MDGKVRRASPWAAFWVMVVSVVVTVWLVGSLTNEDLLWFERSFDEVPTMIVIYDKGVRYCIEAGDATFARIVEAFNQGVAHWGAYEGSAGLSQASLDRLRAEGRLLELHYDHPVQVHTQHPFPASTTFYVPLTGTHAKWRRVFGGITEPPHIGVLEMREGNFERLQAVVDEVLQEARRCDER